MVELGQADLLGDDPKRRMSGLRNLVVFGHATTQALKNLSSVVDSFDDWWAPVQAELRGDPLMKFFWDLRSQILKEGTAGTIKIGVSLNGSIDLGQAMANPPPGAGDFFIGDTEGGSGWEITLPDGSRAKYYADLPDITVEHVLASECGLRCPAQSKIGARAA